MKSTVKLLQYQLVIGTEAVIMLQSKTKKRKLKLIWNLYNKRKWAKFILELAYEAENKTPVRILQKAIEKQ